MPPPFFSQIYSTTSVSGFGLHVGQIFRAAGSPCTNFFSLPIWSVYYSPWTLIFYLELKGLRENEYIWVIITIIRGRGFPPLPLSVTPGRTLHCHSPVRVYHVLTDYTC